MNAKFRVTMHRADGDLDVYENAGPRPQIDSWDAAIRAAWTRLPIEPHPDGFTSATVRELGPHGKTVRLLAADRQAVCQAAVGRAEAWEKEHAEDDPEDLITFGVPEPEGLA